MPDEREVPITAPVRVSPVTRAARNALYADTVNESLFMRPGQWLTRALVWGDNRVVDGAVERAKLSGTQTDVAAMARATASPPTRVTVCWRPTMPR